MKTKAYSSANGKSYIKSGKKIYLKINGKTYSAKTKKGKATFNIKLTKKGTYKSTFIFKGDNAYKKVQKNMHKMSLSLGFGIIGEFFFFLLICVS